MENVDTQEKQVQMVFQECQENLESKDLMVSDLIDISIGFRNTSHAVTFLMIRLFFIGLPGKPGEQGNQGEPAFLSHDLTKTEKGDKGDRGEVGRIGPKGMRCMNYHWQ